MHFLLVSRRLVYWLGSLGWIFLLSGSVLGQASAQNWLDSLSSYAERYSEFASRIALEKATEIKVLADVEAVFEELDRQREEARVDCLANRLLAEEYQPYDFDIRETMWCKGWLGNSISSSSTEVADIEFTEEPAESASADREWEVPFIAASPLIPIVPEFQWPLAIRSQVLIGFKTQMKANWEWAIHQTKYFAEKIQVVVSEIERQRMVNCIASMPALRDVFGRSVMPYDVEVTSDEYAAITIQLWNELRGNAAESGVLFQSSWYPLRPSRLEPFYHHLVTLIPKLIQPAQR